MNYEYKIILINYTLTTWVNEIKNKLIILIFYLKLFLL